MKTVILEANNNQNLKPLTDRTCQALLPIAGKPVIEHTIESLYNAGIKDITISLDTVIAEQVMAVIGDGTRWDMHLDYDVLDSSEAETQTIADLGDLKSNELLLVRGDILWSFDVKGFLAHAREVNQTQVCAVHGKDPIIMWTDGAAEHDDCPVFDLGIFLETTSAIFTVPIVNSLESLADFHQANIDLITDKFPTLTPRGSEICAGLILDFDTKINTRVLRSGVACVGRNCNIHKSVELESNVVIGDRVLIDRGTRLENTVVLPDTYIGEMVTLKDAIVWGNTMIRIDSGLVMELDDELLCADMAHEPKSKTEKENELLSKPTIDESVSSTS